MEKCSFCGKEVHHTYKLWGDPACGICLAEEVSDFCHGCPNLREDRVSCDAFEEPFPMWGKTYKCWARPIPTALEKQFEDDQEQRKRLSRIKSREVHQARKEDEHRGEGGGGGEKADRTNKAFGPQVMKDNRFPWRKNGKKDWSEWS